MKTAARSLLIVLLVFAAGVKTSQATTVAYYPMGDPLSSLGPANIPYEVTNSRNFTGATDVVTGAAEVGPGGLAAPGSTAALDFDGANDGYYRLGDPSFVPANLLVEIWGKPGSAQTSELFSFGPDAGAIAITLDNNAGAGPFQWIAKVRTGPTIGAAPATVGTWAQLAVLRTGGLASFYVNGILIGSAASTSLTANDGSDLHLGVAPGGTVYFDGVADALLISAVPEPAGLTLMGLALVGMARFVRRRRS